MSDSTLSTNDVLKLIEKMGEQNKIAIAEAVATAITETNKPAPPTPQQIAQIEQDQQIRQETSESDKQARAFRWKAQEICTHEHAMAIGGIKSHAVWVQESFPAGSPGFMLCQKCQGRFRPEQVERKLDPGAHYNTAVFNKMFQDSRSADLG